MQEDGRHLPQTAEARIVPVDLRLGRRDRADPQRRPACVASCRAVAQEQRRMPTANRAAARVERMLSVVATCRQQNRKVLELLTACCRARLEGSDPPCFAARRRRTGRRLIGQSPSGRACQGRIQAKIPHQREISGPVSKNFGNSWVGGGGVKLLAILAAVAMLVAMLKVVPFDFLPASALGLERLRRGNSRAGTE